MILILLTDFNLDPNLRKEAYSIGIVISTFKVNTRTLLENQLVSFYL